ncbi:hypothetical protein PV325_002917 [Microctonus aethiopoides]|nr:hypothetical protein PV325_002917 [Microctonus aethiopoides]
MQIAMFLLTFAMSWTTSVKGRKKTEFISHTQMRDFELSENIYYQNKENKLMDNTRVAVMNPNQPKKFQTSTIKPKTSKKTHCKRLSYNNILKSTNNSSQQP